MKSKAYKDSVTASYIRLPQVGGSWLNLLRLLVVAILAIEMPTMAMAAKCEAGSLADYVKLGDQGCTWGDFKFYDFKYVEKETAKAIVIPAKDIKVVVGDANTATQAAVDIDFTASWGVGRGEKQDPTISYEVLVLNAKKIDGVALIINNFNIEGGGTVNVWEHFPGVNLHVFSSKEQTKKTDSANFPARDFGLVTNEVELDSNGLGGANLGQITNEFVLVKKKKVKLNASTSPDSGASGISYLNISGTEFPEGNIIPANVAVELAAKCHGVASGKSSVVSITSGSGDSQLLSFPLPAGLDPGQYYISISDYADGDANFESGNCAVVNVVQ